MLPSLGHWSLKQNNKENLQWEMPSYKGNCMLITKLYTLKNLRLLVILMIH